MLEIQRLGVGRTARIPKPLRKSAARSDRTTMKLKGLNCLLAATLLLSACMVSSFERSTYLASENNELLAEILLKVISPTDQSIYAQDANNLAAYNIDWEDVASFSSACQLRRLRNSASRTDLEIIHFLWVKNAGNENSGADAVKSSLGEASYKSAIEAYGGAAFDCQLETLRFIDDLKAR